MISILQQIIMFELAVIIGLLCFIIIVGLRKRYIKMIKEASKEEVKNDNNGSGGLFGKSNFEN